MGQCCSKRKYSDSSAHHTETTNSGFDDHPPINPLAEEDRNNHVRELVRVVLRSFRESLDEYEKHPHLKEGNDDLAIEWVHWMNRIIEQMKAEFNPLMDRMRHFTDKEKTTTTYLISRIKLNELGLESFPKHEEAIEMGLLKEVEIDDMRMKLCREFNRGIHTHFISHKWAGNSPDTEDNAIFNMAKDAAHYLWFDYTCVPQDDHVVRLRHLLAIADICHEATVVRMNGNADLEKAYNNSVWCQLEAALLQWDDVGFDPNMTWTIYDWNDCYAVLPAFLDLWVNSHKNNHFFEGREGFRRTSMIVSMLESFAAFHDSKDSYDKLT